MEKNETAGKGLEYVPGVCNIGPAEIRRRKASGWIGLAITVVLWGIFILARTPQALRLFVFLPAMLGASGFFQAAFHFCAGFGMKGVFNFGAEVGKTDTVMQAEFRKKDREKAMFILLLSVLAGGVIAMAAYLIRL